MLEDSFCISSFLRKQKPVIIHYENCIYIKMLCYHCFYCLYVCLETCTYTHVYTYMCAYVSLFVSITYMRCIFFFFLIKKSTAYHENNLDCIYGNIKDKALFITLIKRECVFPTQNTSEHFTPLD